VPQHPADSLDLVGQVLDAAQALQAQQFLEPAQQPQPGMFDPQP
jgi:hypothetical protein